MKKMCGRRRVSIGNDNVALSQRAVSRVYSRDPCGPRQERMCWRVCLTRSVVIALCENKQRLWGHQAGAGRRRAGVGWFNHWRCIPNRISRFRTLDFINASQPS